MSLNRLPKAWIARTFATHRRYLPDWRPAEEKSLRAQDDLFQPLRGNRPVAHRVPSMLNSRLAAWHISQPGSSLFHWFGDG